MPPQLSLANFSRKLTSLFTQKRSNSSSSKKTKSAIKIQSTFRGRNTRKKLTAQKTAIAEELEKKIVTEAERLFNNANKSKAKKAIIDMGRDVDQERIEIMLWHLWADLTVKQRNTWLTKARKKLSK
jgi:hypothetical protein